MTETIAEDISRLNSCVDQLKAKSWARIAQRFPPDLWTDEQIESLKKNADSHDFILRFAALGIVANRDDEVRKLLLQEASDGSPDALAVLGSVRKLPPETIRKIVPRLVAQTSQIIADAKTGRHDYGYDPTHTLSMLNIWHPDESDWEALCAVLEAPAVMAENKASAMVLLGFHPEMIPAEFSQRVGDIAKRISTGDVAASSMFGHGPRLIAASAKLALLLDSFEEEEANARLIELLAGDSTDRRWAAHALAARNLPEETPILVGLLTDQDPHVRSAAAAFVAGRYARRETESIENFALFEAIDDPGTWVPARIAEVWADFDELPEFLRSNIETLRKHRSAHVRSRARECEALLEPRSEGST